MRSKRLPRVSSPAGIQARVDLRVNAMPRTNDKFRGGFTRPGSRNPRKVGRG